MRQGRSQSPGQHFPVGISTLLSPRPGTGEEFPEAET